MVLPKYDLIQDFKSKISSSRIEEIVNKLESSSDYKYKLGNYEGSIKDLRRAEKYYN